MSLTPAQPSEVEGESYGHSEDIDDHHQDDRHFAYSGDYEGESAEEFPLTISARCLPLPRTARIYPSKPPGWLLFATRRL
jgi:hypothetical protein